MKKMIAILLVALMVLSFAACAKKDKKASADPIVGTWAVDYASMMSAEEIAQMEAFGMSLDQMKTEFTFNADGTGRAIMEMYGESQDVAFTYTAKDGKLTLTATQDGETSTMEADYTIDGNTLTMTEDGETMTFKRK